ncbi:MAG: TRAP transporter large permease subunit [Bilophila wadsworthia]
MMEALSPANIGLLLFGIFFVLLLIGSPIMVALGVATMACFIVLDIDLSLMIERAFASLTAFPLTALPAFVLAGSLSEAAGVQIVPCMSPKTSSAPRPAASRPPRPCPASSSAPFPAPAPRPRPPWVCS